MFFTKRQLEQIRQYIAAYGIRTTDFPDTSTVTADDYIAIVQGGVNKKVQVSDLFDPELLPSLIVDINIKDNWNDITDDDHDSALSARLGKQLKDWQNSYTPIQVIDGFTSTDTEAALSANKGRELYNMISNGLTVINDLDHDDIDKPLSAAMGKELKRIADLRPTLQSMSGYYKAQWTGNGVTSSINIYTKEQVDALLSGYTPGPGGATSLSALDDVSLSSLTGGDVLSYDSSSSKWKNVSISSLVSERDILIGSTSIESNALNFVAGSNVNFSVGTVAGVTTLTIGASGGTGGGGGDYYIGNTKAHPTTADPYQLLAGLGSVEILGTGSAYGAKRIYFGSSSAVSPAYIEWDDTNSCFHFSHGLYSDDFVSAGGYNGASGGGTGGSTSLAGLTDDVLIGTLTSTDDGKVLTYEYSSGMWKPKTPTGGTVGSVAWGAITGTLADQTDLVAALAAKQDASTAFSGSYNDLTNKPNLFSGNYNDLTNKPSLFSGNYNDLSNKPTTMPNPYALILGQSDESPRSYTGASEVRFSVDDLTKIIGTQNDDYIQIGKIKIRYNNDALYFEHVTTGHTASIAATGNVAAGA